MIRRGSIGQSTTIVEKVSIATRINCYFFSEIVNDALAALPKVFACGDHSQNIRIVNANCFLRTVCALQSKKNCSIFDDRESADFAAVSGQQLPPAERMNYNR